METPTNPMLKDLRRPRGRRPSARKAGAILVVDNTFATPVLQRPLDLGAHVALHSTTKYLETATPMWSGGAIVTSEAALAERIGFLQNAMGAVPSPFDCYLVLRSLKTLGVPRPPAMRDHCTAIAARLVAHPKVSRVHYPGLASHRGHGLAARQIEASGRDDLPSSRRATSPARSKP